MLFPPNETTTAAAPELTEDQVHAELLKDSATGDPPSVPSDSSVTPVDPPADQANPTDAADQPAETPADPPAEPNPILDELRALRAEMAEIKAAQAANAPAATPPAPADPTAALATRTLAQIDADEQTARRELRYLADKIAKRESHIEPDGTEYTPEQMQLMVIDRQDRLYVEIPKARAAAQATTTQRTTVEAAVRQQYPTQFVPGTPAHAMNAAVAKEFAHLAHTPDFPRIVAEVTLGRLATRAIKPAAKAPPPNLPSGSATRPSVTGPKQPLDTNAQLEALQRKYPNGDIPEEELQRLM